MIGRMSSQQQVPVPARYARVNVWVIGQRPASVGGADINALETRRSQRRDELRAVIAQ
jgi:hypothetical protein